MKALNVHTLISLITVVLGVALLIYMISVESEPGAIPLLLIVGGTGWYFISRTRPQASGSAVEVE
jgi:hypothetical protein